MVGTATPTTRTVELVRPDQELLRGDVALPRKRRASPVLGLVVFGAASLALYGLFFGFVDDIFPVLTSGTIGGAVAVIGLALTFSLAHGSFASALLEVVGFRALKKG